MTYTSFTDGLILRELTHDDWIDVHKYASQEIVCQYQPWGPNTEEDTKNFVDQAINDAAQSPRTRYVFAIVTKDVGKLIGIGEFNIRDFYNKNGEIAYIVHPGHWGKGVATSVAKHLISFGFTTLNLHRIYATCDPRNTGSARVLEKSGMILEGRIRESMLIRDGWRDSLLYSILENECHA
ncbi:GNAT family N-acetyltransferase [Paenibacillus sp. MMS18-CY102]|uniref:GNAT family N-acetyltransferase n=1 Tax=Paenibacillus sp. MMS18-CY102 TaxID=2682849 RepID=UPI00136544B4|nr:GNAT family protein [Paenibacillus sp. MMS18-CY102]MWC29285.1 GNAT family N-acetyltransferase [Paenibacillus sp. MMS18-CY102]